MLFHGSSKIIKKEKTISIVNDRSPRNTPERVHHIINQWFDKNFGIKLRSSSFFCTGNKNDAIMYTYKIDEHGRKKIGTLCQLTPIGNISFCYSKKVKDLYGYLLKIIPDKEELANIEESHLINILDQCEYEFYSIPNLEDQRLIDAVNSKNEIMLVCDKLKITPLN